MRIALVSTPFVAVPPPRYGGTELLVAISASQARRERAPIAAIVHHGLSPDQFPFVEDQGYLLYLGRYSREKGPHLAIEVAARSGLPLVMAGEIHERDYYCEQVAP